MPKVQGAERGDVDGTLRVQFGIGEASGWGTYCRNSRLREHLPWIGTHGTQETQKDCQTNSAAECNVSTTFSLEARKSSSERTIHDMLFKKTGA